MIDELDQCLGKVLGAIEAGLRDYDQSIENNFKEIVKISESDDLGSRQLS